MLKAQFLSLWDGLLSSGAQAAAAAVSANVTIPTCDYSVAERLQPDTCYGYNDTFVNPSDASDKACPTGMYRRPLLSSGKEDIALPCTIDCRKACSHSCLDKGLMPQYPPGGGVVSGHVAQSEHWTLIFNVFVLMTIFNELNSRKLQQVSRLKSTCSEWNVFIGVTRNKTFLIIFFITLIVQVLSIQTPFNEFFKCTYLGWEQWIVCVGFGAGSLLWQYVVNGALMVMDAMGCGKEVLKASDAPPPHNVLEDGDAAAAAASGGATGAAKSAADGGAAAPAGAVAVNVASESKAMPAALPRPTAAEEAAAAAATGGGGGGGGGSSDASSSSSSAAAAANGAAGATPMPPPERLSLKTPDEQLRDLQIGGQQAGDWDQMRGKSKLPGESSVFSKVVTPSSRSTTLWRWRSVRLGVAAARISPLGPPRARTEPDETTRMMMKMVVMMMASANVSGGQAIGFGVTTTTTTTVVVVVWSWMPSGGEAE